MEVICYAGTETIEVSEILDRKKSCHVTCMTEAKSGNGYSAYVLEKQE